MILTQTNRPWPNDAWPDPMSTVATVWWPCFRRQRFDEEAIRASWSNRMSNESPTGSFVIPYIYIPMASRTYFFLGWNMKYVFVLPYIYICRSIASKSYKHTMFRWSNIHPYWTCINLVGGLEYLLVFHILGMSSSQLTNSMIFQRGRLNHQPVIFHNPC